MANHLWLNEGARGVHNESGLSETEFFTTMDDLMNAAGDIGSTNAKEVFKTQSEASVRDIVSYYFDNPRVKRFIDVLINGLETPAFILARRSAVDNTITPEKNGIDPKLHVLSHAIQILLFAPVDFVHGEREYSVNPADYAHRFPSPVVHSWESHDVAEKFSGEDLYRAVCMYFYTLRRRTGSQYTFANTKKISLPIEQWVGYCDTRDVLPALQSLENAADSPQNHVMRQALMMEHASRIAALELRKRRMEEARAREEAWRRAQNPSSLGGAQSAATPPPSPPALGPEDDEEEEVGGEGAVEYLGELVSQVGRVQKTKAVRRRRRGNAATNEEADVAPIGAELDEETFRVILRDLKTGLVNREPDDVNKETQACLTSFTQFIDERKLSSYLETQEDIILENGSDPVTAQRDMIRCFSMNSLMTDNSINSKPDIRAICERIGFDYPQLVPHRMSPKLPYKPHQIHDIQRILDKLERNRVAILANSMGT